MTLRIKTRTDRPFLQLTGVYRGRQVREQTGFRPGEEKAAEKWMPERQRELDKEIDAEEALARAPDDWRRILFDDAALVYLEKGGSSKYLGAWSPEAGRYVGGLLGHFAGKTLGAIDETVVFAAIRVKWPKGIKAATKNRNFLGPLIAVFNAVKRKGAVPPVDKLDEEEPATRSGTPAEVRAALEAYADLPHLRLLIMCMTITGRRISELTSLPRDALGPDGVITIGRTKNGDPILITLPDFVARELLALPLFPNGRLFGYKTRHSVYDTMKVRCADRGIVYLPPHQIGRHTFAMTALKSGMNLKQVQEAGGWKSLGALLRYLKLLKNEEQSAATDRICAVMGFAPSLHQGPAGVENVRNINGIEEGRTPLLRA